MVTWSVTVCIETFHPHEVLICGKYCVCQGSDRYSKTSSYGIISNAKAIKVRQENNSFKDPSTLRPRCCGCDCDGSTLHSPCVCILAAHVVLMKLVATYFRWNMFFMQQCDKWHSQTNKNLSTDCLLLWYECWTVHTNSSYYSNQAEIWEKWFISSSVTPSV